MLDRSALGHPSTWPLVPCAPGRCSSSAHKQGETTIGADQTSDASEQRDIVSNNAAPLGSANLLGVSINPNADPAYRTAAFNLVVSINAPSAADSVSSCGAAMPMTWYPMVHCLSCVLSRTRFLCPLERRGGGHAYGRPPFHLLSADPPPLSICHFACGASLQFTVFNPESFGAPSRSSHLVPKAWLGRGYHPLVSTAPMQTGSDVCVCVFGGGGGGAAELLMHEAPGMGVEDGVVEDGLGRLSNPGVARGGSAVAARSVWPSLTCTIGWWAQLPCKLAGHCPAAPTAIPLSYLDVSYPTLSIYPILLSQLS